MIFLALFLLQIKHFICDFVLQSEYQIRKKALYGHRAGLTHAGTHILGSIPALLMISVSPVPIGACLVFEFVVHYHADWLKARFDNRRGSHKDRTYWTVFGLDQLVHQLTYVAILYFLTGAP
jgi:hypothetical protein